MRIAQVTPLQGGILHVIADDGRSGTLDIRPYLDSPAFQPLKSWGEFSQLHNGGYYVAWRCGADLSADTIEARWTVEADSSAQQTASAGAAVRG